MERKSCSYSLLNTINDALLCRRRCAGGHAPLRIFHFAFDDKHCWDDVIISRWISYVVRNSTSDLDLDLQFRLMPICRNNNRSTTTANISDDDGDEPSPAPRILSDLPATLFNCVALRSLRLSYCWLQLPVGINLPNVETLHLTGIHDGGRGTRRLISSCPRLADLTLQNVNLTRASVLDKRLRRFALRCCHNVKKVDLDASELTTLVYKGKVPAESLLTLHGSKRISWCNIDFCDKALFAAEEEFNRMGKFLEKVSWTQRLHLEAARLGSYMESNLVNGFPSFASLLQLELTGCLETTSAINAVRRILERTPNLEVLILYLKPPPQKKLWRYKKDEDDIVSPIGCDDPFVDADAAKFSSIWCLGHRMREINLVHYMGSVDQRMLARLLLSNALVLEEYCVVLPEERLTWQNMRLNELQQWVVNKSAKANFR